jgi:hypothetical protein
MSDLLKTLGDNWHVEHPYMGLIQKVLPSCPHAVAIEKKLLEVYVQQHNDFKIYKDTNSTTLFDSEIEAALVNKKRLEEERKKEEERFTKQLEKLKELDAPESSSEEEKEEEEEEEEEVVVKHKGKGQQACRRTLKKEALRQKSLVSSIKASMATSQMRLMELNEEIEKLEKISEYYTHYRNASRNYILGTRRVALAYSQTKDVTALIKGLAEVIPYYEHMMRRYVPSGSCQGQEEGLCDTHLLPLGLFRNPETGFRNVLKCSVSP